MKTSNRDQEGVIPERKADQKKTAKEKMYNIVFRQNRTMEVRIKGETIRWEPNGKNPVWPLRFQDGIPESTLNHKDFNYHKKYFVITEK